MTAAQRVELYTAPFCANCDRARELLERAGVAFAEIDLSRDLERCCELEALTGGRSTPQIVIDGRPIAATPSLQHSIAPAASKHSRAQPGAAPHLSVDPPMALRRLSRTIRR